MLFNEPKLLKCIVAHTGTLTGTRFSALQRAEIAEIKIVGRVGFNFVRFSALQRAEIAEMYRATIATRKSHRVSVLFNEPKLLK